MQGVRKECCLLVCMAGLLVVATGCGFTPQAHFRFEAPPQHKSISFDDAKMLEANLPPGSLSIVGWDKPTVEMTAKVWAKGIFPQSAERLAKETKVDLINESAKVLVTVEPAVSMMDSEHIGVDIVLRVPRQAAAKATSDRANMFARDLAGTVKLNTTHGDLSLQDLAGPAECTTTHGNVRVSSSRGPVIARTTFGNVRLTHIRGDIDTSTTHGDVQVEDGLGKIKCHTTHGDVTITAEPGSWKGENLDAQTTFGNIRVCLAVQQEN